MSAASVDWEGYQVTGLARLRRFGLSGRAARAALVLPAAVIIAATAVLPAHAQPEFPAGAAFGDAGTAVGMMRLLAGSVPPETIVPELVGLVSGSTSFEAGFGLSNAQTNATASLPFERSIAQASPYGAALSTGAQPAPGGLIQTAAPDNADGLSGVIEPPPNTPVNPLVSVGEMRGTVHARWSADNGPCRGKLAESGVEIDRYAAGFAVPTLPDIPFADLPLRGKKKLSKDLRLPGGLGTVGGLLAGKPAAGGEGSLVTLPDGMTTRATISADPAKAKKKAVTASSSVDIARLIFLHGSPLAMTATVKRKPSLTVVATGDEKTSDIKNTSATIIVKRGKENLFTLDAKHPRQDVPIGVPTAQFFKLAGAKEFARDQLVMGGVAVKKGGRPVRLVAPARNAVADLFVLRLSVGGLDTRSSELTTPFAGSRHDATARLLDVQLIATKALAAALGTPVEGQGALPYRTPSTLAQYSVGELVARAAAPRHGVRCGEPGSAVGAEQSGAPSGIQSTTTAAAGVPLLWTGALLLLAGVVLLTIFAPRRQPAVRPSPVPRDSTDD